MILIGPNLLQNAITPRPNSISVLLHKFQFKVSLFTVLKSTLIYATDPKCYALQLPEGRTL
jgi:hypothetical protein